MRCPYDRHVGAAPVAEGFFTQEEEQEQQERAPPRRSHHRPDPASARIGCIQNTKREGPSGRHGSWQARGIVADSGACCFALVHSRISSPVERVSPWEPWPSSRRPQPCEAMPYGEAQPCESSQALLLLPPPLKPPFRDAWIVTQATRLLGWRMGTETQKRDPLPSGWWPATDEATGKTYYWNDETREASWERPVAPPAPPAAAATGAAGAGKKTLSLEEKKKVRVKGDGRQETGGYGV